MKDSNWIIVLKLKDFVHYFSIDDLIQLSLICKKFRNCLSPIIFNTFNFSNFTKNMSYETCNTFNSEHGNSSYMIYYSSLVKQLNSKMIESKNQFKLDLKLLPNPPRKLEIYDIEKVYYLLYDIPNVFSKLTTMAISNSTFQFKILQYLLDNLYCLDNIALSSNNLLQYAPRSTQIAISWPSTLKKLKVSNNNVIYIEHSEEPALLTLEYMHNIPIDYLVFSLKRLHKLKSFEHGKFYLQNNDDNICEFLKLNSQLTSLKILHSSFNPEIFSSIKQIENLSSLYLSYNNYEISEVNYSNATDLTNVEFLAITLSRISEINCKIIEKFPNLTNLLVEMHCVDLEKLSILANNLNSVKNLSLKININLLDSKELNIANIDCLKRIEFIMHYGTYIDDINLGVSFCSNLKVVEFSKAKGLIYKEYPKINPKLINCWNVVYFPHKATYYRIL
jgi:hypothetical protein